MGPCCAILAAANSDGEDSSGRTVRRAADRSPGCAYLGTADWANGAYNSRRGTASFVSQTSVVLEPSDAGTDAARLSGPGNHGQKTLCLLPDVVPRPLGPLLPAHEHPVGHAKPSRRLGLKDD